MDIEELIQGVIDDPKVSVWYGVMYLVSRIYLQELFLPILVIWVLLAELSNRARGRQSG